MRSRRRSSTPGTSCGSGRARARTTAATAPSPTPPPSARQLQRAFPEVKVVKALNWITFQLAVDPGSVPGVHVCPIRGDDAGAKEQVRGLLAGLGWTREQILDFGGIEASRDLELFV